LGEEYRSWSSSLWSFLHSPVTLSLLAQIISSTPYSQTPSACIHHSMSATKFHTHTKKQQTKLVLYNVGTETIIICFIIVVMQFTKVYNIHGFKILEWFQ
jgi:hypothetical protein